MPKKSVKKTSTSSVPKSVQWQRKAAGYNLAAANALLKKSKN